ncbi:ArsR/SmtB family transcription factor [Halobacteriaceae archaeon GCM10025711]
MTAQNKETAETTTRNPCCESTAEHSLAEEELAADVQTLTAMANATRYEALRLIADEPDGRCVCELEPALGVSQGAVSQALSRLYAAGLLTRRKEGRWRYYSATASAQRLLDTLDALREEDDA